MFLSPGLDTNIGMLTYQIKNYPDINYDTWPPSIIYKDVNCDVFITSVIPKISFQINYKAIQQLEVIPFVTCMYDMSVVKVFIGNSKFSDRFVYLNLNLNFGLEAIFFETYQLSSFVKLLNDETKTKIINISFSFPL